MKVFLSVFVIAFVAKVESQLPVVQFDMNEFMAHQQQHQAEIHHEQARQMEAEEPIVGSPLLPLKLKMGMPFGLHHALGGLGIPGMRLSNFHAGNIGGLKFGNMLLGAENPMAEEGEDGDALLGKKKKKKWHKFVEPMVGEVQHYQAEPQVAAPPHDQQIFHHWFLNEEVGAPEHHHHAEPHLAAPPHDHQIFHHWFLNEQVGEPQQHYHLEPHLAAPQQPCQSDQHQVGASPFPPQPVGPPVPEMVMPQQPDPNVPQPHPESGARHFDKWFKGNDDYGYGDSYE
jgi:hypothetical protein